MARLGTAVLELRTDAAPLAAGLRSAEMTTKASTARIADVSAANMVRAGQSMSSLGRNWTRAVSLPLAVGAAAAVKFGMDFQAAMERVHTQAGASTAEVTRMTGAINKLAPQLGQTPTGLANALFHVESEGFRGAKALDILTAASKLASIGGADLETTVNGVVSVMQTAPKDIHNATDAIGLMNAVVGTGNMRLADLNSAMGTGIVSVAKQFGLGFRDVGAALDIFTGRGMNAASSATRLGMAIRLMAAPTQKAADTLKTVGINQNQLADDMRKPDGLVVTIQDLKDHMDKAGLSATQQGQLVTTAFGARSSQAILLMMQNVGDLQKRFDEIGQRSGAGKVAEEWQKTQHSLAFQFDQIKAQAAVALEELGLKLGPTLIKLAGTAATDAAKLAQAFSTLPGWAQHAIVTTGLLAIAFGPAMRVAGVVTLAAGRLIQAATLAGRLITGREFLQLGGGRTGGVGAVGGGRAVQTVATMEVGELLVKSMIGGPGGAIPVGSAGTAGAGAAAAERSMMSKAVTGLAAGALMAGLGVIVAQIVGGAVHGGVGQGVKEVGTDAAIGAGLGRVFGPPGIIPGAVLGAVVGGLAKLASDPTPGQAWAKSFSKGIVSPQAQADVKKAGDTLDAILRKTTTDPVIGAGRGAVQAVGGTAFRERAISKSDADRYVAQVQGALVNAFKGAKAISPDVLMGDFRHLLAETPARFRGLAAQSMLQFTSELFQKGKISQAQFTKVIKALESEFPGLAQQMGVYGGLTATKLADSLKLTQATKNLHAALSDYKQQFKDLTIDAQAKGEDLWKNAGEAMKKLKETMKDGTSDARKAATTEFDKLRHTAGLDLSSMVTNGTANLKALTKNVAAGTAGAAKAAGENFGSMVGAIRGAMASGVIASSKGAELIGQAINAVLKTFKGKLIPAVQAVSASSLGTAQKVAGISALVTQPGWTTVGPEYPHARGGLVQLGHEGDRGPDNIPLQVNDARILAGRGEKVAVFTGEQQRMADILMAPIGGLRGLFGRYRTPHPATRRFAQGGMASLVTASDFTGGATASGLPASSTVGFAELSNPPSSLNFSALGNLPMFTRINVTYPAVAGGKTINIPKIDVGAGGPALPPASVRAVDLTMPAAGMLGFSGLGNVLVNIGGLGSAAGAGPVVTIGSPKIKGSGTVADITRLGLGLATRGANAYLATKGPSAMAGPMGAMVGPPGAHRAYSALVPERTDQGVDFGGAGPVGAVGAGRVLSTGLWPGWPGTGGIVYQIPQGKVYIMEGFSPSVTAGTALSLGQIIGQATGGPTGIETGWANAAGTGPLTPYNGLPDGTPMLGGKEFRKFIGYKRGGFVGAATGLWPTSGFELSAWIGPRKRVKAPSQPKHGFQLPKAFSERLAQLDAIMNPDTGIVAKLQDRYTSTDALFQAENPNLTYVVTQDAQGNAVTPYIDWNAVNLSLGELNLLKGWENDMIADYGAALKLVGPLLASIENETTLRRKQIAYWKARIRANLQAMKGIQNAVSESAKQDTASKKLAKLLELLGVEHDKLPSDDAGRPARKAIAALIDQIRDYASKHDAKAALGQHFPTKTVNDLRDVNETFSGDRDTIGTGGFIGKALKELDQLQTDRDATIGYRSQIQGPSGIGGDLLTAKINLIDLNNQITALSPAILAAQLAQAQPPADTSADTSNQDALAELVKEQNALLAEQNLITASEAATFASLFTSPLPGLPPFGGSFAKGGIVPGALGQPVMIEAHGGEQYLGVGENAAPDVHVYIDGKGVALERLIDMRIEQRNREAVRRAGRRMPSGGGGAIR